MALRRGDAWRRCFCWRPGKLFEMASGAAMPAAQLAGYHTSWHLGGFERRVRSGLALTIHLGWFLFPVLAVFVFRLRRWVWTLLIFAASPPSRRLATERLHTRRKGAGGGVARRGAVRFGCGVLVARLYENRATRNAGCGKISGGLGPALFFAAALFAFYAGAARYLLPLAAPLALLAARERPRSRCSPRASPCSWRSACCWP